MDLVCWCQPMWWMRCLTLSGYWLLTGKIGLLLIMGDMFLVEKGVHI